MHTVLASLALLAGAVSAQQTVWGQCGGNGWSGPTSCVAGSACSSLNAYYFQCIPGATPAPATSTARTSSAPRTTTTSSSIRVVTSSSSVRVATTSAPPRTSSATSVAPPRTSSAAPPPTGSGPGTTLQSGYYWIRAVADPNFHKYMQSSPLLSTGPVVLNSYTTAGQFQIVNGQLMQLIGPNQFLYANVDSTATNGGRTLAVSFSTTQNTYGTFAWSGDALTWSVPGISRPNLAAWYVCESQRMYINLGAYLYNAPAGCVDQTIHYYNGATANL